ncbi:hypothetical protein MKS83_07935 [Chryseobacterium sp. Y16C]|nr:hypothetical protein [Chryseobacterium sp. Y16C]UMQ43621.1 hypothetical protein MKS83_07935 [Chryseobacterium sp. Y16C]
MKLEIEISEFQSTVETFISQGENLKNTYRDLSYDVLSENFTEWKSVVISYLDNTLNEPNNMFTKGFKQAKPISYMIQNLTKVDSNEELKKSMYNEVLEKISILKYFNKLIKISDAVTIPESTKVKERVNYTTKQKLDLILEKLYDLNGNRHYPIELILELNGIILQYQGEGMELAKALKNMGLIDVIYSRNQSDGKINLNGKMYVEEKREATTENYDNISSNQQEINEKINEVLEHLKKLGYGQEIIFEEIEELKSLHTKLSKKNWGQVLKGKLLDLALSKLVENDTISYVYEHLTNNHLRLP